MKPSNTSKAVEQKDSSVTQPADEQKDSSVTQPADEQKDSSVTQPTIQLQNRSELVQHNVQQRNPAEITQQAIQRGIMLVEIYRSMEETNRRFDGIINRIRATFWSILLMNWILIGVAVALFVGAFYSALGGKFEVAGVLSAMGVADILSVFVFAMNRVQTSLGDQVQVQLASNGYIKQILNFDERLTCELDAEQIRNINEEIRKATRNTMELIQNFTKIGKESSKEPWINPYPIRYGNLNLPDTVFVGEPITVTGVLTNKGDRPVTLTSIVIAIRPPLGTPMGGPFDFDFTIQPGRVVKSGESVTISDKKAIEIDIKGGNVAQVIPPEYIDKKWYGFMTCQTDDGNWHDDPSKKTFIVKKKT
jgi:hypothetical protein